MNLRNARRERGQTSEVTCRVMPFARNVRGRGTRGRRYLVRSARRQAGVGERGAGSVSGPGSPLGP